jgi:hypothetical protein
MLFCSNFWHTTCLTDDFASQLLGAMHMAACRLGDDTLTVSATPWSSPTSTDTAVSMSMSWLHSHWTQCTQKNLHERKQFTVTLACKKHTKSPRNIWTCTMNHEQIFSHSKRRELTKEHYKIFNGDTTWYLALFVLILTICRPFLLFLNIKQNR